MVLAVTPGIPDAERLSDDLHAIAKDCLPISSGLRVLEFPALLDDDRQSLGERLKTLSAVRSWSMRPYPCVVTASFPSLAMPVPAGELASIALPGISFTDLARSLADYGYERNPQVFSEGQFSIRGGIVDVWSPGDEFPIRAEFFGEDLESIRQFNPSTQTSIARLNAARLLPTSEDGGAASRKVPFTDLLPRGSLVIQIDHNEYSLKSGHPTIFTGEPAPAGIASYAFQTTPLPGFAELGADEAHHPELFDAARARLEQHLAATSARGGSVFKMDAVSGGFEIGRLAVVAKSDRVFTRRKIRTSRHPTVQGARLNDFDDLEVGEYVVHLNYGVGRYLGTNEIVTGNGRSEVYTIEYADGAKLNIPASHAHLLSRYVGVKGEGVKLHRLDGKQWRQDKADAQKAVCDLATALLETQARRETVPGFAYDTNCDGIEDFESAFPYEETPDQLSAIAAIKSDLAATKPMDRLICGDAGYGKTEVAMRAAYIAAMNGKQVAVLAPTTVLAEQHFETFTSRFDGTPVRIEAMSRFQSAATHTGTFKRLATGVCDIVIGTHAILSKRIAFHDLGLIIIDEEQRFGVRHKEYLKRLRATADVLTLSATPIPRTLYMSMTGARDLSLLRSPPRERVAVDTRILVDNDEIVKAAIEAELERDGQVFFLHNRVNSIATVEKRLNALFPNGTESGKPVRVVVAHGRMDASTLARKMRDFERGKCEILLSTTIVESGIDIPRANTIIVDHAEMFGLADLYQLRGRVGRSSRQGHALLLLPPGGVDAEARERLQALKRHGGLGSGFNLAMRDLEIRGAGNLLGSQQSGHIAAIGFTLYCQMLQRTIAAMKGEAMPNIIDVKLNLDFIDLSPSSEDTASTAAIPRTYVSEDVQRMSFMRRIGEAADIKVVKALREEMKDRFGPLPPATMRLMRIAELRICAANAGIGNIDVKDRRAFFYRSGTRDFSSVIDLTGNTADRKIAEIKAHLESKQRHGSTRTPTMPSERPARTRA